MGRRLADEPEWPLQTRLAKIRDAGFDGAGYAITGPDGRELSDRWQEALVMKDMIRALWDRIAAES